MMELKFSVYIIEKQGMTAQQVTYQQQAKASACITCKAEDKVLRACWN
jgi:hypothetical protein